ncbi:MAG: amidohydrolase family protein, partial [Pseudomonadota bacterium]
CTLLPGLVDAHVHLCMSGTADPVLRTRQLDAPFKEVREVIRRHLQDHLASGVLAVRDGGDHAGHVLRYKKEDDTPSMTPVRILCPGKAWHAQGRYGRMIGQPPPDGKSLAEAVIGQGEGADHVKIVNSGINSLTCFGRETPTQFRLETLRGAVDAGKALGMKTMIHANGKEAVRMAIDAGCHSIEHGFFMGEENLKRMAERRIAWVPTACTMAAYTRTLEGGCIESDTARRNLDHQLAQIEIAHALGVPLAVGTDAGSLGVHHGQAVREEIGLFLQAGFSLEEAVQCASSKNAELLGVDKEIGRLIPGMPATLIALPGGPENLSETLREPAKVYVKGEVFIDTSGPLI